MKKFFIFFVISIAWNITFAHQATPVYTPGGALSYVSVLDAFSAVNIKAQPDWWYFAGLLQDNRDHDHSLQVTLIQTNLVGEIFGVGMIGFSFQNSVGQTDYLWNLYPDPKMIFYLPVGKFNAIAATKHHFQITIQPFQTNSQDDFLYQFNHDDVDDALVGELNSRYHLIADGVGEVGESLNHLELVQYQLQLTLQDKRGMVPEGNGGFIGDIQNLSWEWAMPNMRVLLWKMTISPIDAVTPRSPVQTTLTFSSENNSNNRIWFDRQSLFKSPDSVLNAVVRKKLYPHTLNQNHYAPLYRGTWMAFCFDQKPYRGICADAVAFWKTSVATQDMNSDQNASGGFMNLFLPDSGEKSFPMQASGVLTEMLSIKGNQKNLPYEIQNDAGAVFTSPVSGNHYAKTVYLKLKPTSLFATILNYFSGNHQHAVILKWIALSQKTENSIESNQDAFYEGAARVYLCDSSQTCHLVGTGFMEQMGYF